ncbi:histidine kinase [Nocardia sp. CDC186]|uniref:histidine kinase n=1 Tax=Nocardia implantans TaxID=3108168 RepID=A0ABU6AWR6_9NOCA|nr:MULTISPECIES: histidine kinase [unclassified Nocardia]MBF6193925.1 sensor histidine kinase [Nocardia beijingensis]MEA3529336.1 histidine kinase [Nocardia sp. CDC192]MEB3511922.1 histidine kinase [Nocardia sp. CDC186]
MERLRDWAIAVGIAVFQLVSGLSGPVAGWVLLVAGGLSLAASRRAPVVVLAVTGSTALAYQAIGVDVPAVAFLFAVYAAFRAGRRVAAVAGSVVMVLVMPLALLIAPRGLPVGEAFAQARGVLQLAWLVAAGAAGEALRQAERRAEEAERTREETARRRADEERLHIARELHDSLTHQISVIKLQAEVAVHLARRRGEQVPEALLAILAAGREASRELRATLEALRDDREPSYGLDQVPALVEGVRATGLDAKLTVEGQREALPAAVDRTAYRIVQESLTNITRHAAADTASVHIEHRPDALVIRVDDDGRATPDTTPAPGVGLLGMSERVTALGGRLHAAPRGEGGFTVRAELPVERAR